MSKSSIYWGAFLLTIGTLLLINKFTEIESEFVVFISLWPMFLIFWGLSLIHFPEHIRKLLTALSAIFLALFLFAIFTNGIRSIKTHIFYINDKVSRHTTNVSKKMQEYFAPAITSANLKINFGAGDLKISDSKDSSLISEGAFFDFKKKEMPGNPNRLAMEISASDKNIIGKIDNGEQLDVLLPQHIDWFMEVNIGAADADFNFSKLKIKLLKINCGASDIDVKLGDKIKLQEVSINSGASDITIYIPGESGCKVVSNTFLTDVDVQGFTQTNDTWKSGNYDNTDKKIEINLDGAVSAFKIIRY